MLLVSDVFVFGISRIHDKSSMTFADVYGLDDDNDASISSILHIHDILICPASSHRLGGEMSRTAKPQSSANCLLEHGDRLNTFEHGDRFGLNVAVWRRLCTLRRLACRRTIAKP